MKFVLDEHPKFRQALIDMVDNPAMLSHGERLLNQLEKFEKDNNRYGELIRSSEKMSAYCIGDKFSKTNAPVVFAIIIGNKEKVLDARIFYVKDIKKRAWETLYKSIIDRIERFLRI